MYSHTVLLLFYTLMYARAKIGLSLKPISVVLSQNYEVDT